MQELNTHFRAGLKQAEFQQKLLCQQRKLRANGNKQVWNNVALNASLDIIFVITSNNFQNVLLNINAKTNLYL